MLKYLFIAEYEDGSTFLQPEDNKCKDHDDTAKWNPSAFGDIDQDRLVKFHLVGEGHKYTVDLTDGHFEIDGVPFVATEQNFYVTNPLRLVYFREVRKEFDQNMVEMRQYVNRYFIGWQTNDENGKNVQQTIAVE